MEIGPLDLAFGKFIARCHSWMEADLERGVNEMREEGISLVMVVKRLDLNSEITSSYSLYTGLL